MKATLINVSAIENEQGIIPKVPQHFEYYYPIICNWWKEWNWPPVNPRCLPDDGIIIDEEGENICAGWLWLTNSSMCVVDLIVTAKKKFAGNLRKEALDYLIINLEQLATFRGFKEVFTCARNPYLIKKLLNLDYGKDSKTGQGDDNVTVFIKKI